VEIAYNITRPFESKGRVFCERSAVCARVAFCFEIGPISNGLRTIRRFFHVNHPCVVYDFVFSLSLSLSYTWSCESTDHRRRIARKRTDGARGGHNTVLRDKRASLVIARRRHPAPVYHARLLLCTTPLNVLTFTRVFRFEWTTSSAP